MTFLTRHHIDPTTYIIGYRSNHVHHWISVQPRTLLDIDPTTYVLVQGKKRRDIVYQSKEFIHHAFT